jgi:hypothetical protein
VRSFSRGAEGGSDGTIEHPPPGTVAAAISNGLVIDNGHADVVLSTRTKFQEAIEASFVSAVERATGRRVIKIISNTGLDHPHFAVEVFRLEPALALDDSDRRKLRNAPREAGCGANGHHTLDVLVGDGRLLGEALVRG